MQRRIKKSKLSAPTPAISLNYGCRSSKERKKFSKNLALSGSCPKTPGRLRERKVQKKPCGSHTDHCNDNNQQCSCDALHQFQKKFFFFLPRTRSNISPLPEKVNRLLKIFPISFTRCRQAYKTELKSRQRPRFRLIQRQVCRPHRTTYMTQFPLPTAKRAPSNRPHSKNTAIPPKKNCIFSLSVLY